MTRAGTGKANLSDSRISFSGWKFSLIQEKIGNKSTRCLENGARLFL